MGQTSVLLTLMTASLVASQQQQQPCDGGLTCLINQATGSNPGTQSGNPSVDQVQLVQGGSSTGSDNEDDCECVPYYQCQNNTIITNGIGIIDIRLGGACKDYLEICCKRPDVLTTEKKLVPVPSVRRGCGQRNPQGVGFSITGNNDGEAQFGEFPWMVAILREETDPITEKKLNVYQCGGSLIHPRAVLTAAHCVNGKNPSELFIRAGEWDTQTQNEIFPHQDRKVRAVTVHEHFHPGALFNDVALLILKSPVVLGENIDVVCLPESDEQFDGTRCFASGWGKDKYGKGGRHQVILKKIELPIVPSESCQNSLRQTRLGRYFRLDRTFVCAGGEPGKDTCKGDGGSPLVCPTKNDPSRYVQVGIVAWGIGCGENQIPGVYGHVARLREWIDENMIFNNLDTNMYRPSQLISSSLQN